MYDLVLRFTLQNISVAETSLSFSIKACRYVIVHTCNNVLKRCLSLQLTDETLILSENMYAQSRVAKKRLQGQIIFKDTGGLTLGNVLISVPLPVAVKHFQSPVLSKNTLGLTLVNVLIYAPLPIAVKHLHSPVISKNT